MRGESARRYDRQMIAFCEEEGVCEGERERGRNGAGGARKMSRNERPARASELWKDKGLRV